MLNPSNYEHKTFLILSTLFKNILQYLAYKYLIFGGSLLWVFVVLDALYTLLYFRYDPI